MSHKCSVFVALLLFTKFSFENQKSFLTLEPLLPFPPEIFFPPLVLGHAEHRKQGQIKGQRMVCRDVIFVTYKVKLLPYQRTFSFLTLNLLFFPENIYLRAQSSHIIKFLLLDGINSIILCFYPASSNVQFELLTYFYQLLKNCEMAPLRQCMFIYRRF